MPERAFSQRMYYHYRLRDRYNADVVSLAVPTDDKSSVGRYHRGRWGCERDFWRKRSGIRVAKRQNPAQNPVRQPRLVGRLSASVSRHSPLHPREARHAPFGNNRRKISAKVITPRICPSLMTAANCTLDARMRAMAS